MAHKITKIALFAALICAVAPFTVPIGPVPLSLATFAIYLAAVTLGAKQSAAAVLLYILLGAAGVPVFSGFRSGTAALIGPTGGFIIGYIPLALIAGGFARTQVRFRLVARMAAGTVVLYMLGTAWFMLVTGCSLQSALLTCVVPFLPGDALKISAASAIAVPLMRINRAHNG